MKVALVYDRVNKWGGAERVLLALNKNFPNAPLYTSVYNREKAKWARVFDVRTSFLQKFPFASYSHEFYAPLMPLAFESFNFDKYDLVISVTSEAAKGIIVKPGTFHICICLTPTRYLWSGYDEYFKNILLKIFGFPLVVYLKFWDKIASQRPDRYIAISHEVKDRIKKYYNRESSVIFPPFIALKEQTDKKNMPLLRNDYFLIVSRLVPYKKIDIAVKACKNLNIPLKIVGTGHEDSRLKKIAGEKTEFLGQLTDEELSYYYQNCRALIFPGIEDFGLVMIEAQSFGKPVIAFRKGGALDIIREGTTGDFFDRQIVSSLEEKLKKFNPKRYNSKLCIENSERFVFEIFKKQLNDFIEAEFKNL